MASAIARKTTVAVDYRLAPDTLAEHVGDIL